MQRPSVDALLLFALLAARVRIDTLAEWAAIPTAMLQRDVARLMGGLLPVSSLTLLADRQTTDPVTLLLVSGAFGLLLVYLGVDVWRDRLSPRTTHRIKMGLLIAILAVLVFGQTFLYIGLRHLSGPATYTHDGGVIQTEATIHYLLAGINPYVADYLNTPMAEWGTEYRTALYHYPYLPWTFLFSAPFYLLAQRVIGWFDQRMVYLFLFALTLALAYRLAKDNDGKLAVVMLLGLNPILASDVIFGQNDSFVLFWIVLGVWLLWLNERHTWSQGAGRVTGWLAMVSFGLACASKPTAWFLAPFVCLYVLRDDLRDRAGARSTIYTAMRWSGLLLRRMWPLALVFVVVVAPWFVWNPGAMVDDVWRWSAGTAEAPYQIRGWGFSNFILALGMVADRLAYWPFWVAELLVAAPLLALALWQQARRNGLGSMLYGYVVLLFAFFYVSRFLNENYLVFLLSVMALAAFVITRTSEVPER